MSGASPARVLLAFLLVLIGLAYAPGLFAPFYLDDQQNIVENPRLRMAGPLDLATLAAPSPLTDPTRIVSYYSFYLNGLVTGLTPGGLRAGNLLLHLLNTFLAFAVFRAFLRSARPDGRAGEGWGEISALAGAALWGLHPLNSQAVLYVVQRMTLLAGTFFLLGLLLYLEGRRSRGAARLLRWAGLAPCLALAYLSKPVGLLLPAGIVLLELFLSRATRAGGNGPLFLRGRATVAIAGASALALLLLLLVPIPLLPESQWNRSFTPGERVLTEGRILVSYASAFLLPAPGRLHFIHDPAFSRSLLSPHATLAAWVLILGGLAAAVVLRRRCPLLLLAVAWFFLLHLPEAGPFPLELAFEHRNYLPTLFPALLLGSLAAAAFPVAGARLRRPALLLAGALVLALAASTAARAFVWSDRERLLEHDRAAYPASARLATLHAKALKDAGRIQEARSFIQGFLAKNPAPVEYARGRGIADLLILLGNIASMEGDLEGAASSYLSALETVPGHQLALENLARVRLRQGRPREALAALDSIAAFMPGWPTLPQLRAQAQSMLPLGTFPPPAR